MTLFKNQKVNKNPSGEKLAEITIKNVENPQKCQSEARKALYLIEHGNLGDICKPWNAIQVGLNKT